MKIGEKEHERLKACLVDSEERARRAESMVKERDEHIRSMRFWHTQQASSVPDALD